MGDVLQIPYCCYSKVNIGHLAGDIGESASLGLPHSWVSSVSESFSEELKMQQSWEISFRLARSPGVPLYRQLAGCVVERVDKGLLAPGAVLPGTRALAKSLGVHRNTVKAAYDELLAAGWVSTAPSRGTFIAAERPRSGRSTDTRLKNDGPGESAEPHPRPEVNGVEWAAPPIAYCRTLVCSDGLPDPRLAPMAELSRAVRRALRSKRAIGVQDPRGNAGLRAAIAEMLRTSRSIRAEKDEIVLTGGRGMGLFLVAQALLSERAAVAVEQPGNQAAWRIFEECGLRVIGIPVDSRGLRTDYLERCAGVSAVYVTPARQYPTTVSMSLERRERLLAWCRKTGALIIEDDYDSEFAFESAPLPPLASMDPAASLVHIGTISRMFAPSVESGFIRARRPLATRLGRLRHIIGCDSQRVLEAALYEMAADGMLRRHLRRLRDVYRERRDQLALALRQEFGSRLKFELPEGGLAMWVEVPAEIDTCKWAESARRLGVRFSPSADYRLDRSPRGGIRIGYGAFSSPELLTMAATLRRSLPADGTRISIATQKDSDQFRRCIA